MIEKYSFGKMDIDSTCYTNDLIIYKGIIKSKWWRIKGHNVFVNDIIDYLDEFKPESVIFGTGKFGLMKVSEEVVNLLEARHIEAIIEKTGTAWEIYNSMSVNKNVMGAFHLTC